MPLLENKIAIVTGAGRGIGSHIAELFASEGARVIVHYHTSRDDAEKLAKSLPNDSFALQADLRNPKDAGRLVEEVIARCGRIDILVNNAASFAHDVRFTDDTWDAYTAEWNGVMGTTFHVTHAVVPHMIAQGGGKIVNFCATLLNRPADGFGAHTTSKGAVLAFTRALAHELGPSGITVNAVSPGMTLTDYSKSRPESLKASIAKQTPLRRLAEPSDVARVVLFYASDLAGFVTGANIAADGGLVVL